MVENVRIRMDDRDPAYAAMDAEQKAAYGHLRELAAESLASVRGEGEEARARRELLRAALRATGAAYQTGDAPPIIPQPGFNAWERLSDDEQGALNRYMVKDEVEGSEILARWLGLRAEQIDVGMWALEKGERKRQKMREARAAEMEVNPALEIYQEMEDKAWRESKPYVYVNAMSRAGTLNTLERAAWQKFIKSGKDTSVLSVAESEALRGLRRRYELTQR